MEESQSRDLEAGTEAETMEEHYLLACFLSLAQPDFLCNSGPPAKGSPVHSGLGPLMSIV